MSVRKRSWKSPSGEAREAWVVDYIDQHSERHLKTFTSKRDADAYHSIVAVDVRAGIHTADSRSGTIASAGELWIASSEASGLERATLADYRQRAIAHHIDPDRRNQALTTDCARWYALSRIDCVPTAFAGPVRKAPQFLGASWPMRKSAARGAERGAQPRRRKNAQRRGAPATGKLKSASTSPRPTRSAHPHRSTGGRTLAAVPVDGGLHRATCLRVRGLRWSDVDFKRGELHVRQRADRYNEIGLAEVGIRLPHRPIAAYGDQPSCVNGSSPALRANLGSSSPTATAASRLCARSCGMDCIRRGRRRHCRSEWTREVPGLACTAPLLRVVVHQPPRRWRTRIAAQGGAGAARSCLDPDDRGHATATCSRAAMTAQSWRPPRKHSWDSGESMRCPVCETKDARQAHGADFTRFDCRRCGSFILSGSAVATIETKFNEKPLRRSLISHTIRRMQQPDDKHLRVIKDEEGDLPTFWRNERLPTPQQQADNLILWIGENQETSSKVRQG